MIGETESKRTEIRQTFVISGAETGFKAVGTRSDGLKEGNRLPEKRSERGRKEDWGRSKFSRERRGKRVAKSEI